MWLFPGISQHFLSGPLPGLVGYHLNLSKEGAKWGGKCRLGEAERHALESQSCMTLHGPLPFYFPSVLLCKVAAIEAPNSKDCSEDSVRSCSEKTQHSARRRASLGFVGFRDSSKNYCSLLEYLIFTTTPFHIGRI